MSYIIDASVEKLKNGSVVRLSKKILEVAGFSDSEEIEIVADTHQIIIKKRRQIKNLDVTLENYDCEFYELNMEEISWLSMWNVGDEW